MKILLFMYDGFSMEYKTEQEKFWASDKWGKDYVKRNNYTKVKNFINFFSKIISKTNNIKSIIEFGSNIGLNLIALNKILPDVEFSAIEINSEACKNLENLNFVTKVYNKSILDFEVNNKMDLVLIKGVLIHINPEYLNIIYKKLYDASSKYILICEYYNPEPIEVEYRGESGKLFKRDFAGELLDKFNDLELLDYGFNYHRDNNFPMSDVTWFLLEKK